MDNKSGGQEPQRRVPDKKVKPLDQHSLEESRDDLVVIFILLLIEQACKRSGKSKYVSATDRDSSRLSATTVR